MPKSFVTIRVRSIVESLNFYCGFLGFKLKNKLSPSRKTELALIENSNSFMIQLVCRHDQSQVDNQQSAIILSFKTDDLKQQINLLKGNGYPFSQFNLPGGKKGIHFEDPNGVSIAYLN
ncbi:VOC family protein [Sunxiuqinia elliptica]|uniref:Catechol 2,3-dioxygenase-like lactoylglutathione lyase family enzyme n=1 Tax=Sunxiuqinia elliptica TaxID=655355 RepID=A0A4R6HC43_9BACT|nr:VOC family protein [Sunxiuqinia elliptica]TDO05265.1 catechol 2,3-dioxygenase-like lactoylglutathione lyase family enzyme [Sunxiuqinia elliptica]TDO64814.1 catechol 2,3-dioxygenase-like lactoylglutathione lyase family enzyme [Sunxiuqinia elliptica]